MSSGQGVLLGKLGPNILPLDLGDYLGFTKVKVLSGTSLHLSEIVKDIPDF